MMRKSEDICALLLREVRAQANPQFARYAADRLGINAQNYFGLRTEAIYRIADVNYQKISQTDVEEKFSLCERLLDTGVKELKYIAFRWAYRFRKEYKGTHLAIMQRWLNYYVSDWADCDFLCTRVIGEFFLLYPHHMGHLVGWTKSSNRWMRRGAAVSMLLPVAQKSYLPFVFTIARLLLSDDDEYVQKACACLLKTAAEKQHDEVLRFIEISKKGITPGTLRCLLSEMNPAVSEPVL